MGTNVISASSTITIPLVGGLFSTRFPKSRPLNGEPARIHSSHNGLLRARSFHSLSLSLSLFLSTPESSIYLYAYVCTRLLLYIPGASRSRAHAFVKPPLCGFLRKKDRRGGGSHRERNPGEVDTKARGISEESGDSF